MKSSYIAIIANIPGKFSSWAEKLMTQRLCGHQTDWNLGLLGTANSSYHTHVLTTELEKHDSTSLNWIHASSVSAVPGPSWITHIRYLSTSSILVPSSNARSYYTSFLLLVAIP